MELSTTIIIIIITSVISMSAMNSPKMLNEMIFYPAEMKGGKGLHRFLTHGLLHADFIHLLFNMLTLYYFGPVAEAILGTTGYIILYVTALVASSLPDYFRQQNNYGYRALGASGAVSAILFATIIMDPWARNICLFGIKFLCLPNMVFGIAYILYSQYMDKRGGDNIGHNAHMWGGVYGFVFTALWRTDLLEGFIYELTHPSFLN